MLPFYAQPLPSSYPAVMPLLDTLGLTEEVEALFPKRWDNGVTHADVLTVLLLMILDFGGPRPISRVNEWAEQFGIDLLLGIDPAKLHDDKIGHTLDALVPVTEAGECDLSLVADLHNQFAHTAITRWGISTEMLHYDFTDIGLHGAFTDSELARRGKGPTRRQLQLGLNSAAGSGFPILSTVHPGATNHTVSVPENLAALMQRLPGQSFCVVTDAGGGSYDNFRAYNDAGQHFISARQLQEWEQEKMRAIPHKQFELTEHRSRRDERFWVHRCDWAVHPKDRRDELMLSAVVVLSENKLLTDQKKARKQMRELLKRLVEIAGYAGSRGNYSRPDYVRKMAENALNKYADAGEFVQVEVSDEPALSWWVDWAGFARYMRVLGRYVLFTNLPEDEYSAEYVLEQYRGRHVVEASYRQLKSDLEIAPLHMHKDNRLLAMAAIWVIALMLLSLLQLLARRAELETKRGQALTGRELLQNLLAVTAVTCTIAGQIRASVGQLSQPAQRYLTAMNFPDPQHWLKVPPIDMQLISGI
ncbi:MAG: IS1634 family transposase [Armatimonadota bacterium]